MIAAPSTMLNVKALTPSMMNPSRRIARTSAPRNAPITVPDPPVSSVPPMTAAATASNTFWPDTAAPGSNDPIRIPSIIPAKPASIEATTKFRMRMLLVGTPPRGRRSGCRRSRPCRRPTGSGSG